MNQYDLSIDDLALEIYHPKTRDYFNEVRQSYYAGSYRSALVMCWTVVVCDLYYKLLELRDVHGDPAAESLLRDIDDKKNSKNKSEWETYLVEEIATRLRYFDEGELATILRIKDLRHRSAHPVLSNIEFNLYQPTREDVLSLVKHALVMVFTRNPLLSKKVVSVFVEDLAIRSHVLPDVDACKSYIEHKWLTHMPDSTIAALFKALWKFAFRLENEHTKRNRQINTFSLVVIAHLKKDVCVRSFRDDPKHYSSISPDETVVAWLNWFLQQERDFWQLLPPEARAVLDGHMGTSFNKIAAAFYRENSLAEHLVKLTDNPPHDLTDYEVKPDTWEVLKTHSFSQGCTKQLCQFAVSMYKRSPNFSNADTRGEFVESILHLFDEADLFSLILASNDNSQIYRRNRAAGTRMRIMARAKELQLTVEEEKFTGFFT